MSNVILNSRPRAWQGAAVRGGLLMLLCLHAPSTHAQSATPAAAPAQQLPSATPLAPVTESAVPPGAPASEPPPSAALQTPTSVPPLSAAPQTSTSVPPPSAAPQTPTVVPPLVAAGQPVLVVPTISVDVTPAQTEVNDDVSWVGDSWGGTGEGARVGILSFRFLLQARYTGTHAASSQNDSVSARVAEDALARDGDGFSLNRFFVRIGVDPSKYLEVKTIVDLAELSHNDVDGAIKQAYATLKPIPKHLEITAGIFKLPFSVLELDPIAKYPLADVGLADSLVKDLGFGGKDVGAEVVFAPLPKPKRLRFALGLFRGHAHDENGSPLGAIAARVETQPIKGLRFGLDWVEHPQGAVYQNSLDTSHKDVIPDPTDPQYPRAETWTKGRAFSADARFQRYHMLFEVEGLMGKRVDYDLRYGASTFDAVWAMVGYRFRVGPVELLPVVRAEWLDTDLQHPVGLRRELTFALNVDFSKATRLVLDVTRTDVQANSPLLDQPKPYPAVPYYQLDDTRVVVQLQVAL